MEGHHLGVFPLGDARVDFVLDEVANDGAKLVMLGGELHAVTVSPMVRPMPIRHQQRAIDLGIVITDSDAALAFYRDLLGLDHEGDIPFAGLGLMHRLRCGDSLIKLIRTDQMPDACPAPGGIDAGTGLRYFTIHMENLDEMVQVCRDAGVTVVVPPMSPRPGLRIAIVEDPDRNLVEFVTNE